MSIVGDRHEGVAHIFARQVAADHQPVGLQGRHVLHRMDGDVDAARSQRLLDLAGEEALAADLLQRAVEHPVAGGLDHHDLEGGFGKAVRLHQPVAGFVGLRERQWRAARADLQRRGGVGHLHEQSLARDMRPRNGVPGGAGRRELDIGSQATLKGVPEE
jgi:hypothetical protein